MCWLFHKWGKWEKVGDLLVSDTKKVIGLAQKRECLICGKIETSKEYYI